MATAVSETKRCQCLSGSEPSEKGECISVYTIPCVFGSGNQTVEWKCDCQCGGELTGRCRFQMRCSRRPEDGPCECSEGTVDSCDCDRNTFIVKCLCSAGACTVIINKCKCCEVTRVECGNDDDDEDAPPRSILSVSAANTVCSSTKANSDSNNSEEKKPPCCLRRGSRGNCY